LSHISRFQTQMMQKEYVLQALKDLGYNYEEGEFKVSGFGSERAVAQIKISLRLSNDIGLRETPEGYQIIADWFGVHGINQKDFTQKLMQRYAYNATRATLEAQGFNLVEEEVTQAGKAKEQIRLVLRRMA
jgi:hypothetical protein